MRLVDVNVLVHAFRADAPGHAAHRAWVEALVGSDEAYAVSDHVLAGFLRVVTHPITHSAACWSSFFTGVWAPARLVWRLRSAFGVNARADILALLLSCPAGTEMRVADIARRTGFSKRNAALAIESGCEFVTTDRDYARFPGLRWRHPLDRGRS